MTLDEIKNLLKTGEYGFLQTNPHLGKNIVLLGLGGSHAYGTNVADSDVDIRGCATLTANDILTCSGFEQVVDNTTDTTIYSLPKLVSLLAACNPNTIEMLGLKKEHYLYFTDIGSELVRNSDMFLSKRAVHSFGGYANAQLRRLENKAVRTVEQARREEHILNSIKNVQYLFNEKYSEMQEDSLKLYIDNAVNEEYDKEIFMDVNLTHYPLRDYKSMWSELNTVVKDYAKLGKRNEHAIEHGKLAKHQMHLVRLYLMAFDILEDGKIVTYREKDHDFLMKIRGGAYLDGNDCVTPEFFEIVDELDNKLNALKETTPLPAEPDWDRINKFLREANSAIVSKELVNFAVKKEE